MLQLENEMSIAKRIKLIQLFFERKFVEKNSGKIPLNDFKFNKNSNQYEASNDEKIAISLDEYRKFTENGYVEVIEE
jgi:hypothetical protein